LQPRPFSEDLHRLADSALTVATIRDTTYIAADLTFDASGMFMTGLLGFTEQEVLRQFETRAFSWIKGDVRDIFGATTRTVVPFAIDTRENRRWGAYAVSSRIRSLVFRRALAATLNEAVAALRLLPSEWEVDPVSNVSTVVDWVDDHPDIVRFSRRIQLTNPLVDVDEARRRMRALGAREDEETYRAWRNETLTVDNDTFRELIADMETGDIEVILVARTGASGHTTYKSSGHVERTQVPNFGSDLPAGVEAVLDVLRAFSEQRGDVVHGDQGGASG
jgi:hypothetical protein